MTDKHTDQFEKTLKRKYLKNHPKKVEMQQTLETLRGAMSPEVMELFLPHPQLRGLLLALVLVEIREALGGELEEVISATREEQQQVLLNASPTLRLMGREYKPLFMDDLIKEFQQSEEEGTPADQSYRDYLENDKDQMRGVNSTLRNLIVAEMLNRKIFEGTEFKADIALGKYTWMGHITQQYSGQYPDFLGEEEHLPLVKFIIAIRDKKTGEVKQYIDYGAQEHKEQYGITPTGEGISKVAGTPTAQYFDPSDLTEVIEGLEEFIDSVSTPLHKENLRRFQLHLQMTRQLVDFIETPEGKSYPTVVAGVDDLSIAQMNETIEWARKHQELANNELRVLGDGEISITGTGVTYGRFRGKKRVTILFDQPSTRTLSSAKIGAETGMGLEAKYMSRANTSAKKGESLPSLNLTQKTLGEDAILWRGKDFEDVTREMADEVGEDNMPSMISLGGQHHHPTQTLGEVMAFMQDLNCDTIEQLADTEKTIVFMGHTEHKRADKSLIRFILQYLPKWKVINLVPNREYLPLQLDSDTETFEGHQQYSCVTDQSLTKQKTDQRKLQELTKGADYIYTSNAYTTSAKEGKEPEKEDAGYYLSKDVIDANNLKFMAPLPGSEEMDDELYTHKNSMMVAQMLNKISIITSLLSHQLEKKDKTKTQ